MSATGRKAEQNSLVPKFATSLECIYELLKIVYLQYARPEIALAV
jgi:hypothetical protein